MPSKLVDCSSARKHNENALPRMQQYSRATMATERSIYGVHFGVRVLQPRRH